MSKLIVFSAPSGSGKTTLVRHLLEDPSLNLAFSISATSRNQRGTEVDGEDYYFLSPEKFQDCIKNNDFLEWEEVYEDTFYGTLKSELERNWKLGKHVIFDIDVKGGLNIKNQFPDKTLAVFVTPPSIEEIERRLRNRKTDTEEKIIERITKATSELKFADKFDTVLVNNDLKTAKQEAVKLVENFISE